MQRRITSIFILATMIFVGGCGDDDGGVCEPGATQVCNCPGGGSGVQTCAIDGTYWGSCVGCDPCDGVVCGDGFCNTSCEDDQSCSADCGGPCSSEICGNGYCHPDCEDSQSCSTDCGGGTCDDETCGNGVCNDSCGEDRQTCPEDCDTCSHPNDWAECTSETTARICSDGYWQYLDTNDFNQLCVNNGYTDYNYGACEDDGEGNAFYVCCGACAGYGFECGSVQSDVCSWDCGSCPSGETCNANNECELQDPCVNETCGNGNCNASCSETSTSCPQDCDPCYNETCGNGNCNSSCGETSSNCSQDCGVCSFGDTQPCGNCGSQTCLTGGVWGPCTGQGVCSPSSTQPCSNACGSGTETCNTSCQWGSCSAPTTGSQRIDVAKDTYVDSSLPSDNFGNDSSLAVGVDSGGTIFGTLLNVNVALLPPASEITITSAELYMYKISGGGGAFFINLGRALSSWTETSVNWWTRPNASSIDTVAFTCGGACWGTFDITSYVNHVWEVGDWTAHGLYFYELYPDTGYWYVMTSSDGIVSQRPYAMIYYTCP